MQGTVVTLNTVLYGVCSNYQIIERYTVYNEHSICSSHVHAATKIMSDHIIITL